jgi:hypothetical protein
MTEVQAKRFAEWRNWYDAPCCGAAVGIIEDATACKCEACGAWLEQNGIGLSLKARVVPAPT